MTIPLRAVLPSWSPALLGSTLVEWLEPDSMTVATGHVTAWADKSGRGVNLAEATHPPTATTGAIAGQTAATLDGVAQLLSGSATLVTTAYTFAIVVKPGATGGEVLAMLGNFTGGVELIETANRRIQHDGVSDIDDSATVTTWELWIVTYNGTALALTVNGTAQTLTNGGVTGFVAPPAGSKLVLGARWNGSAFSAFAPISIAACLVCNTALSGTNLTNLTSYLRGKYGL